MKLLILGATGMLGNAVMEVMAADPKLEVYGTARSDGAHRFFPKLDPARLITGIDAEHMDSLLAACAKVRPNVIINCIGLIKQLGEAKNPLYAVPLNTLLPHRLAQIAAAMDARLVHVSTDCVFSGRKGGYVESDFPDAGDLYGRSKLMGEVDYPHAITLRTSIIGHELTGHNSLIGWFLQASGDVKGYEKAIFSGLPTVELARVIRDFVLPNPALHGLYHIAAEPINKYALLQLVGEIYGKQDVRLVPDGKLVIDRSLDAAKFHAATGYAAPAWPVLIQTMHSAFKG